MIVKNHNGFNLALVMRKMIGIGKPRRLQGLASAVLEIVLVILRTIRRIIAVLLRSDYDTSGLALLTSCMR